MSGSGNSGWNAPSYEAIVRALFENYESIYDIDVETSEYRCYHESDSYSELKIESSGEDFFATLISNVPKVVFPEDREYVCRMLRKEAVLEGLEKEKYYSFVYRLMLDGRPVYHKIRAVVETVGQRKHIMLGVRNVDETIEQEKAHTKALSAMHRKERNHMEAILASAEVYLEANLTKDLVLERSPYMLAGNGSRAVEIPFLGEPLLYSRFNSWISENLVVEKLEQYEKMSRRETLISAFEQREKRVSVYFSLSHGGAEIQPCREVFYLYRDDDTGDVMSFCVVYDLTEQQRRRKELSDLENELRMSRIRNFTSQMQPHFLYNALASIQEIVLDDPEYAAELLGDFTVHLRSCVRAMASDDPAPFAQELANIKAYVNIEKMRFGEKLKVRFEIGAEDFPILPLSIQPLVENAIRHGIYERGTRGGTVTVRSSEEPKAWTVTVEDDGVGFDRERFMSDMASGKKDSTGLKNIIFRLDKVMNAKVSIQSEAGTGTRITVSVPKGEFDG